MGHARKFKQMRLCAVISMLGRVKNSHYSSCSGREAPSLKMQTFFLSSSSVSNFRDCAVQPLLRHSFVHAKWPTLAQAFMVFSEIAIIG